MKFLTFFSRADFIKAQLYFDSTKNKELLDVEQ